MKLYAMQTYKGAEIHSVFFSVISVSVETNQKCLQHKILNESQEVHDSSRFVCGQFSEILGISSHLKRKHSTVPTQIPLMFKLVTQIHRFDHTVNMNKLAK